MRASCFALLLAVVATFCIVEAHPLTAVAQPATGSSRVLQIELTPTARTQMAIWIERADGTFVSTIGLTQATARRGLGNRPGAAQMNSGFRWPYGRRENVLPVWAQRRAAAPGAELFPRVIFQDRPEGHASRMRADSTRDDYFCLPFSEAATRREALDAVSCASVFMSDKGRYLEDADLAAGYAQPWQEGTTGSMQTLSRFSLYPPRRDVRRCTAASCTDHPDVDRFIEDARRVMPELDAITMATPAGDVEKRIQWDVPDDWPNGDYALFVEVNVEGDYNDAFNDAIYPTPSLPSTAWDSFSGDYGYPYWGQPSVVFTVPFTLGASVATTSGEVPVGFGAIDGRTGDMSPMGPVISMDPVASPGSGGDRLRQMADGQRVRVVVLSTNVCGVADRPPECRRACDAGAPCADGFLCGPDETCTGYCDLDLPPSTVGALALSAHPDEKHAHQWAIMRFAVPESARRLSRYEVRYGTEPITEESWLSAIPALAAEIDTVELNIPTDMTASDVVEVEVGGMQPETTYYFGVRSVDFCNDASEIASAEITTTEIHFTTVSPCFVATAAWGTPLAAEIGTLRRFRDRHLMTNAPGRALVDAYYRVGPHLADAIREQPTLRAVARAALTPLVRFAAWWDTRD